MAKKVWIPLGLLILAFLLNGLFSLIDLNADVRSAISGKVVAEDTSQGLEGVQVMAALVGGGHEDRHYATTDSNGIFVLGDLVSGIYVLGFEKKNSMYLSEDAHVEVILPKGKHVVNVNHVLKLGGSISGTVYDADGTIPISGAESSMLQQADCLLRNCPYSG